MKRPVAAVLLAAASTLLHAGAAEARPARCFTSDDGYYRCDFRAVDAAGSFTISAPNKPTFTLLMEEPGFASGYADFGGRDVPLPGMYVRDGADRACWNNPETSTRICAY